MEYVEGGTLLDHVKKIGKVDEDEARFAQKTIYSPFFMCSTQSLPFPIHASSSFGGIASLVLDRAIVWPEIEWSSLVSVQMVLPADNDCPGLPASKGTVTLPASFLNTKSVTRLYVCRAMAMSKPCFCPVLAGHDAQTLGGICAGNCLSRHEIAERLDVWGARSKTPAESHRLWSCKSKPHMQLLLELL